MQAQVVRAALEHGRPQRLLAMQAALDQRQVALKELVLQRGRRRRDDHAPVASKRVQAGRQQVRQAFACTRAGFEQQLAPRAQGLRYQLRHLHLVVTGFVPVERAGDVRVWRQAARHVVRLDAWWARVALVCPSAAWRRTLSDPAAHRRTRGERTRFER